MAKELCNSINDQYLILINDPQNIITNYHKHLYKINETVRLKKESRIFNAYIKGVSKNGQLITMHTMEEMFDVGEVEWLF
jgi:BirA family biotin operon repressor/biotin-[acetyl-CoA-carboxylase] ligase